MLPEATTSRSLIGATNLIFLDGAIFKAHADQSSESWAIAQATAHTTFGSPTAEEYDKPLGSTLYWRYRTLFSFTGI